MTTKTSSYRPELTAEVFNRRSRGHLPGLLGVLGRTTQVWDAEVTAEASGAKIALFRCTQMVLWPR